MNTEPAKEVDIVERINKTPKKVLAIIVGKKTIFGHIRTDAICIHTGYSLSKKVEFLNRVHIPSNIELIYLIGHGDLDKLTIDGRNMEDIAELLKTAHYHKEQEICITSCYAALTKDKTSMVDELKKNLEQKLNAQNLSIKSQANGVSVHIDEGSYVDMWVMPPNVDTFCSNLFQGCFILVNKKYVFRSIPQDCKDMLGNVNNFKKGLIKSKKKGEVFMEVDSRMYYGATATLFSPIIPMFINGIIVAYGNFVKDSTCTLICIFILVESLFAAIYYNIQRKTSIESFLLQLLYKGCFIAILLQMISLVFWAANTDKMNDGLHFITLILSLVWILAYTIKWISGRI